ncbi:MAG: L,D-transpeptidase [Butyrivibrio sp.]|nr:L,D-transpeptidase [Butyrivibrio sp.]
MKKTARKIRRMLLANLVAIIALYIALSFYYSEGFPCCCWINGVYCTGKSVETVNNELKSKYGYTGAKVVDSGGAELFVSTDDVNLNIDYTSALNSFIRTRNPFAWGYNLFKNLIIKIEPEVTIDEGKLISYVSNWEIFSDVDKGDVAIVKADNGYILDNRLVSVPNQENIVNTVLHGMHGLEDEIILADHEDCYVELEPTESQKATMDAFEKVNALQSFNVTYELQGEEIEFGSKVASQWLVTDDELEEALYETPDKGNPASGLFIRGGYQGPFPMEEEVYTSNGFVFDSAGNPIISEKKMYETYLDIARTHSTGYMLQKYREDHTGTILVNKGSKGDGSIVDAYSEFSYAIQKYLSGDQSNDEVRHIGYKDTVVRYDGPTDLGNTYIEVNLHDQLLSYYVDGELNMQYSVVTGDINRGRGTPAGIYNIYNKRYHTYLTGIDYRTFVNYWLGVNKGIGIHDATWRKDAEFGGETYKGNGSHGCINSPLDQVATLWEICEIGTPVILYY